jgi:predicted NAD/FAD-dependent oxidoreductase
MDRVAIVGAGVAGAGAATVIDDHEHVEASIFERSETVGGRAASRVRGDVVYDNGANYLRSDDGRVNRLVTETLDTDGLIDVREPVYTFDASGTVEPGRDADGHKWSYRSGLCELPRRLLDRTGVSLRVGARIESCTRRNGWVLEDAGGTQWGPFDAVVLTPPAPVASELLTGSGRCGAVVDDLAGVDYRTIYSAALHYPFEIDRPYYAIVNTDKNHAIGWVSREECKPGHVPAGESLLIVQASHEWSVANADEPARQNAKRLATKAASLVGVERLLDPDWTDGRLWRPALPKSRVSRESVVAARTAGLHIAGDAVAGEGRLHAAIRSGLEAGERVVAAD